MGQQPSKDKMRRAASERIVRKEKYHGFGKRSATDGAGKKNIQVTQVLTPSRQFCEGKKAPPPCKDAKPPKPRKEPAPKGPDVRPKARPPAKKAAPTPRATEALAVLVQHLVFNVEAFQVPHLRRQVEKYRLEAEQVRLGQKRLEEALAQHDHALEEERQRRRSSIAALAEEHQAQIAQLSSQYGASDEQLKLERQSHAEQLATLRKKLQIVQQVHEEVLEILREENECIREQIDEKQLQLERVGRESAKLQQDYETKEVKLKAQVQAARQERDALQQRLELLDADNRRLREQNDRLLSYDDKDVATQEVHSLRAVLDLKQTELAKLRKTLEEADQRRRTLEGAEERAAALQARSEDLQHQLQRKAEYEQTLLQENQRLQELLANESNHTRRLNQHNEELQWKLRQNNEVIMKVLERTEEARQSRETTPYDRSPPSSPKVKGVVEKSDSVSYVLDLDDSPDLVASRILRRSLRQNRRPRRLPLSSSASSSSLPLTGREEGERPRSAGEEEEVFLWGSGGTIGITPAPRPFVDDDLEAALPLPALPSEMDKRNGALTLPAPQRLAAEPDSNSEDESTSSSQL